MRISSTDAYIMIQQRHREHYQMERATIETMRGAGGSLHPRELRQCPTLRCASLRSTLNLVVTLSQSTDARPQTAAQRNRWYDCQGAQ